MLMIALMSYLIGSIPFGVLLARAFHLPDPRTIGSGNIGATNMLRTGRRDIAALTLLLDAGKGAVALALAYHFFSHLVMDTQSEAIDACGQQPTLDNCGILIFDVHYAALALTAAALGHMVSPWLKFSGGKGVATILGGTLAFSWPVGASACCIWLLVYITTRYVSLASIIMLALTALRRVAAGRWNKRRYHRRCLRICHLQTSQQHRALAARRRTESACGEESMSHAFIPNPSLKGTNPVDALRLMRSEQVGAMTFFHLVKFCGSVAKAIEMAPDLSRRGGRKKPIRITPKAEAEREFDALTKFGARVILYGEEAYPRLLQFVPDAPPLLTVRGHTHVFSQNPKIIGIVGARNASANGCAFARKLAADLGSAGYTVVSGLARGVDAAAHRGSIATGTTAVIGGGIDNIYPPENAALFDEIAATGRHYFRITVRHGAACEKLPGAQPHYRRHGARDCGDRGQPEIRFAHHRALRE